MVKKLQKMAEKKSASAAGLLDSAFAGTVKDSAQQIWLAGLGAFSKAQEEGGKVFDALVKDCLLYTSPSPRDRQKSRMPSSA